MSWFTQFFGLDRPKQQQQTYQYQAPVDTVTPALLAQLKQMQTAAKERAEAEKKAQDQAAFQSSVQSAQQATSTGASEAQGQLAGMDEQRKATDAAVAASQPKTASGSGYTPETAKQQQYSNVGAASGAGMKAPGAVATSEQQNKTGAKASVFSLPNTEGLTFGGA
jgi:hypothetical protein